MKVGEGIVGGCGLPKSKPVNIMNYSVGDDALITGVLDPALRGGRPSHSMLVQPVFTHDAASGKVIAVILAINKRDVVSKSDILAEEHFTQV